MSPSAEFNWEQMRPMLKVLAKGLLRKIPELRKRTDGSDIVQETLIKAHEAWNHLRSHNPTTVEAWLKGILRNVFKDAVTHALRDCRNLDLEKSIHETFEDSSLRLEKLLGNNKGDNLHQVLDVAIALEQLDPHDRDIVMAHDIEGKSVRAIGEELGLDKNRVALDLQRAHRRLRRLLKDYGKSSIQESSQ